ncbi:MAG TPA: hypothetical protein VMN56_12885 [Casimicrobiaceae bacterium]|nr:hypothetical protein [Casimicrobiaceae bacterium]
MKHKTLLSDRLYYGLDPLRLRAATGRSLSRVVGLPPDRARVSAANLRHDFSLDTTQGEALVREFVRKGLLEPPNERSAGYGFTREFYELAGARIVEPLPRARAKQILTEACALAERINDEDVHNPLLIVAFAVYGDYLTREHRLEDLSVGIVVDLRPPSRRMRFGRSMQKAEGAVAIRDAFKALSSFMRVRLVTDIRTLPRPFNMVFESRGT